MAKRGNIAAAIHAAMCRDSRFGYTLEQSKMWGQTGSGYLDGKTAGVPWRVKAGDYNCSTSIITAWKTALKGTPYEGKLDSATWTGNMESVFVKSGLFVKKPMSFLAHTGDIYIIPGEHCAMCQTQVPDVLSEFSIGENGTGFGNKVGDQTGKESSVHSYYDGWSFILHYNGKADSSGSSSSGSSSGGSSSSVKIINIDTIAKEVIDGKWGNGSARKTKLSTYFVNLVQKRVNELLKG